jgi:hypothetical protein
LSAALFPDPVEQGGTMVKNLADGFEDKLVHENLTNLILRIEEHAGRFAADHAPAGIFVL